MRLFIAFEIPAKVHSILQSAQSKIKVCSNAAFTREFHLTLKFLGETDASKVDSIIEVLEKIKFNPFEASLSNIGVFPSRDSIRVVWVGLEPHDIICALQKQVDDATKNFGIAMDKEFMPHLTLARIKSIENNKEFLNTLDAIKIETASFPVTSFKLIKSTLTPQGPIYEVLKEFKAVQ